MFMYSTLSVVWTLFSSHFVSWNSQKIIFTPFPESQKAAAPGKAQVGCDRSLNVTSFPGQPTFSADFPGVRLHYMGSEKACMYPWSICMFPAKFVLTLANFSTRCSLRLLAFLFALFEQTKAKEDCKCSASLSSCQNPFGNSLTLGFLSLSPLRHDHVKKCKLPRLTAHKCLVFCFVNCKATSHLQSCPIILIFLSSIYLKWYVLKKSSSSML